MNNLAQDGCGTGIQAFPLSEGLVNLTSGVFTGRILAHCSADGDITVTWVTGNTDVMSCVAGDDFTIRNNTSIEITSGTFQLA